MNRCISTALLILVTIPALAQRPHPEKRPWQWSDEERLAKRFDPGLMRLREGTRHGSTESRDVINGEKNPELLMPWELWRTFLTAALSPVPQVRAQFRETYATRAREAGDDLVLDEGFWRRIEEIADPILTLRDAQRELSANIASAAADTKVDLDRRFEQGEIEGCGLRIETLDQARNSFGQEAFDRFLYEAVAPGIGMMSADTKVTADQIRYLTGGCR